MKNAKKIFALFLANIITFSFVGCNSKKLTKDEEMIVANVEYWSEWSLVGHYFKNVQVVGSPRICNEYPIVEITVSYELEKITAGYSKYKVGERYQMTNRCFYEACELTYTYENSKGEIEEKVSNFRQYEWWQEYSWEKAYWNKNLTFNEMNVDILKINEDIDEFIKARNEREEKYEK